MSRIRIRFEDLKGHHRLRLMYNQKPEDFKHSVQRGILYLYSADQQNIGFVVINRQDELEDNSISDEKFRAQPFNVKWSILDILNDPERPAILDPVSQAMLARIVQYNLCTDEDNFFTLILNEGINTQTPPEDIIVPADWMLQLPEKLLPKDTEYQLAVLKTIHQLQDEKALQRYRDPFTNAIWYENKPKPGRSFQSIVNYTPTDTNCYLVGFSRRLGSPPLMCVTRSLVAVENIINGSMADSIWTWFYTLDPMALVEHLFTNMKRDVNIQADQFTFTDIYGSPINLLSFEIGQILENLVPTLLQLIINYALPEEKVRSLDYIAKEVAARPAEIEKTQRLYAQDYRAQLEIKLNPPQTTASPALLADKSTAARLFGMFVIFNKNKYSGFKDLINKTDSTLVGNLLSQVQSRMESSTGKPTKKQEMMDHFKKWINDYFSRL